MKREKYYDDYCPSCKKAMQRRKRDIGKLCTQCTMSKVGKEYAEKRRLNPTGKSQSFHNKSYRVRQLETNAFEYRLKRALSMCKIRAKECNVPFDITLQDLIEIFPKDNKCPILDVEFVWGNKNSKELAPSIDRMIPQLGYVKGNINFISYKANRIKNDSTLAILEKLILYMKK